LNNKRQIKGCGLGGSLSDAGYHGKENKNSLKKWETKLLQDTSRVVFESTNF